MCVICLSIVLQVELNPAAVFHPESAKMKYLIRAALGFMQQNDGDIKEGLVALSSSPQGVEFALVQVIQSMVDWKTKHDHLPEQAALCFLPGAYWKFDCNSAAIDLQETRESILKNAAISDKIKEALAMVEYQEKNHIIIRQGK